uniref:Putative Rapid ALkalinization Factor n=1 Tax=Davidia involucrata TaxID=16924 RepID=A0A5B6YPW8_DAVIN
MSLRLAMILLLALAMVVESSSMYNDAKWGNVAHLNLDSLRSRGISIICSGKVGDCIDQAEEMMMDSESSRRTLALSQRFISYRAFEKDHIPYNRRGQPYYSCNKRGGAYP